MADWGAGWRQAGAGVVDAIGMYQRNQAMTRQEAAERARQAREDKLLALRAEMEKQKMEEDTRRFDLQIGLSQKEKDREYNFDRERFEFEKNDPRKAAAEDRAERAIRVQEQYAARATAAPSGNLADGPAGPNANRVDTALMQEYEILSQASDAEAKQAAAAIYASGLSNEEKLQRLRALRGRLGSNPQMEMIR
jgi:hypothetical protein